MQERKGERAAAPMASDCLKYDVHWCTSNVCLASQPVM
jgi:hypothetical protein